MDDGKNNRQRIIEKLNAMDPGPNEADRERAENAERERRCKTEKEKGRGFTLGSAGRDLGGSGLFGGFGGSGGGGG